jgi:multiple sugar transport system permease protein
VFPLCFGLFISFFDWDILSARTFVGLGNYLKLLSDDLFYGSLWHTVQFVLMTTPILMVAGFVMALVVTSSSPLAKVAENVFFLPYILSMTVVGTLWAWIMQNNYGFLNQLLAALGGKGVGWLIDPDIAMWSVTLATPLVDGRFQHDPVLRGHQADIQEIYESAKWRSGVFPAPFRHNRADGPAHDHALPHPPDHRVVQRVRPGLCDDRRRPLRYDPRSDAVRL